MPVGAGWWLNSRTGEDVPVFEHARAVLQNPERYGLTKPDVAGKEAAIDSADATARRQLLLDVMQRGWIRVRAAKGYNVFEAASMNDDVLYSIFMFAKKNHWWDTDRIAIHNVLNPGEFGAMDLTIGELATQLGVGTETAVSTESLASRKTEVAYYFFESIPQELEEHIKEACGKITGLGYAWMLESAKNSHGLTSYHLRILNHRIAEQESVEHKEFGRFASSAFQRLFWPVVLQAHEGCSTWGIGDGRTSAGKL